MAEPIYKKRGRRYVEIGVYENAYLYYPHGAHLVWSRPGGTLSLYCIEPADAALLAAAQRMRDSMSEAMQRADRIEPEGKLTGRQLDAWNAYKAIAGEDSALRLKVPSMDEVIDAGIQALINAAKGKK